MQLKCTTANCQHNLKCHCDAGAITIDEKGVCDSRMKRAGGALEQTRERLYAAVDRMFGSEGAAARLFGTLHPLTPVDGRFYFDRVLEAVGSRINDTFSEELAKFNANVEKYTKAVEK